jgi:two-component system, OmpR family, sensor kinase
VDDLAKTAGRVIVVDRAGLLRADSAGAGLINSVYATPSRPEIRIALGGSPATRIAKSESLDGTEILAAAAPIFLPADPTPVGAVRITQPTTELRNAVRRSLFGVVAIGIGGLVAGLLIAFVLAGSLARPLQRLVGAARRLGAGDLTVRAGKTEGAKELKELGAAFDEMADRLERLVRAQREFVGNASHQLRTPLTGLKLRLESAGAKAPPELRRDLEAAEREADRLASIVDRLLTLARRVESGAGPEADLGVAVEQAATRWEERATAAGSTVRARTTEGVAAGADAEDVGQILDNLIHNAIRYAPGEVTIAAALDGDRVRLVVEDRGPGIPDDERERVTERFYRGRGAMPGGSGLGLAVVRELAERWHGTVQVKRGEQGGTRIEVLLPKPERPV